MCIRDRNYRGGYGNANIGYSHSDDIKQLYYGVSGGVLAHANGVTLGQPLKMCIRDSIMIASAVIVLFIVTVSCLLQFK